MSIRAIVICRSVGNVTKSGIPLKPGAKTGYHCAVCNDELAATPTGQAMIAAGAQTFCNEHGFELAKRLQAAGHDVSGFLTPQAAEQVERMIQKLKDQHNAN